MSVEEVGLAYSAIDLKSDGCRTNCTILRMVIDRADAQGKAEIITDDKIRACRRGAAVVGACCSTKKNVCMHEGSGKTDDFAEQIDNLYVYFEQSDFVEFTSD